MITPNLQLVLGNDKSKTDLTVYKTLDGEELHIYLGIGLIEVVPNDCRDFFFRFLVARLYSLGVFCKEIAKQLNISEKTIRKLAAALQTGNAEIILQIFSGHSNKEKASEAIKTYIKKKYFELKNLCKNFNKTILAKVKKYWGIELSEEYLRKIFREADGEEAAAKDGSEIVAAEEETTTREADCNDSDSTGTLAPNNVPAFSSLGSANPSTNSLSEETASRDNSWEDPDLRGGLLPINSLASSVAASANPVQDRAVKETMTREENCNDLDSSGTLVPNNVPALSSPGSANPSTNSLSEETASRDISWEGPDSIAKFLPINVPELPLAISIDPSAGRMVEGALSQEVCCGINRLPGPFPAHNCCEYNPINDQEEPPVATQYNELFEQIGEFPYSGSKIGDKKRFFHHLGLVLFTPWLERFSNTLETYLPKKQFKDELELIRQFQAQVLLGALNHERSLELSFSSLEFLVGPCYRAADYQRTQLNRLLTQYCFKGLWQANGELLGLSSERAFYYDPNVKKYTGILRVIKGWCGSIGRITDVMNIDFFHDHYGNPCYAEHFDGYYDQRERLFLCLHNFLEVFPELQNKELLVIFDRGLYSMDVLQRLRTKNLHFITWDKYFKEEEYDEHHLRKQEFYHSIVRNHSDDFIFTHFTYYEQNWKRDSQFRQILVCATSDKGKSLKVAILCSDSTLDPQQIIVFMVRRWLQENDFGYMIRHAGIHELTSRSSQKYSATTEVRDRMVVNPVYKKLQKGKKQVEKNLKNLTFRKSCLEWKRSLLEEDTQGFHACKKKLSELCQTINDEHSHYDTVCEEIKSTPKEKSRKKILEDEGMSYFVIYKKAIMDSIRVSTRNIFYSLMALFRPLLNNRRCDHKIIRSILKTPGIVYKNGDTIHVELFLTYHLEPKERQKVLQLINLMSDKINREFNGKYMPISIKLSDDKSGPICL